MNYSKEYQIFMQRVRKSVAVALERSKDVSKFTTDKCMNIANSGLKHQLPHGKLACVTVASLYDESGYAYSWDILEIEERLELMDYIIRYR